MILDMRRSRANLPNRCCRQIDRIAYRAFDGKQWMDREGRAATTRNTYCGNLLWQSSLTLLALNSNAGKETPADVSEYYSAPVWKRFGGHL